ncbi:MAG TPA: site-specific DNA-methyltransferase [Pyrinomonadaceae bacterium]|nr:site-specific DNA-methyltransferase [Pyrinomonadaceae bacterium]
MNPYYEKKGLVLYQADCLEAMRHIPDASIDACITDPPYGTTACSWDAVIPFAPMWVELKRIVKKNGAIVLFGSQPFTSALVMSHPAMFKYEWIWEKNRGSNFATADFMPMKEHESLLVFGASMHTYNPQLEKRSEGGAARSAYAIHPSNTGRREGYNFLEAKDTRWIDSDERVPRSIQKFNTEVGLHPNQKPIELLRYLVRTYTNEGDTVLDFTCGSGTTGVACVIERRQFIGIEQDAHYCEVSAARIKRAQGVACDIPKRVKQYAPTPLFEAVA